MGGARDTGWTHTRLVGDRDLARSHVPEARKLLGYARQQAGYMGLGTYKATQQLLDGTTITAELHGGIPRITVEAGRDREPRLVRLKFNGIVVWARSSALPDGIDPDFPQQLLRGRGDDWRTYTKSGVSTGRSDGTYGGRFIKGLARAGNVDWVSVDGERISWYGGSTRLFLDPYIHPRHQRGKFVFHLGEPLLDIEGYIAESDEDTPFPDRYVCGAAIARREDGMWLYVVQSLGADGSTTVPPPDSPPLFDYPLAGQGIGGGLHRYGLIEYINPEGLKRYKVKKNSREKLQNLAIGHDDSWFFNQSCTQFVAHGILPPDNTGNPWHVARLHQLDGPDALDPEDDVPPQFWPSTIQNRYLRSVDGGGTVTASSVVVGGAAVPVAAEFEGDTLRTLNVRFSADFVPYLGFDGVETPLYLVTEAGTIRTATQRWLLYANLRDRLVVLLGENRTWDSDTQSPGEATAGEGVFIEVYLDGVQINRTILYPPAPTIPTGGFLRFLKPNAEMFDGMEGRNITPSWFAYGLFQRLVDVYDDPPDEETDTWKSETTFLGFIAGYRNLARPAECYFGVYSPASTDDPVPISTLVAGGFAGNQPDEDGNFSITGAAMERDEEGNPEIVLSVAIDSTGQNATFGLSTIGPLADLTGVSGPGERYHPVWALGRAFFERTED